MGFCVVDYTCPRFGGSRTRGTGYEAARTDRRPCATLMSGSGGLHGSVRCPQSRGGNPQKGPHSPIGRSPRESILLLLNGQYPGRLARTR